MKSSLLPALFIFFFSGYAASLDAQHIERCDADEVSRLKATPFSEAKKASLNRQYAAWMDDAAQHSWAAKSASGTRWIIPVVVHVMRRPQDINIGDSSNVTNEAILKQITILNEDYRRTPGSRGDSPGKDMQLEFQLAQKDPQGRCTSGILRVPYDSSGNHNNRTPGEILRMMRLSHWPPTQYLNMYVVHSIRNGQGYGYASFPWDTGTPALDSIDGFVAARYAFGLSSHGEVSYGRTATHEIGHWLGVLHPFEGACKNDTCNVNGDAVCDTPPEASPTPGNFLCSAVWDGCNTDTVDANVRNPFRSTTLGGLGNQPDMIQNYMDYSNDSCMNRFTPGQFDRAYYYTTVTRASVISNANAIATGVKKMLVDFDSLGTTIGLNGTVKAMVEWPEKDKLVIAGNFTTAGGIAVKGLCTWDGTKFDSLTGTPTFSDIRALAVYKGSLYVGGSFNITGRFKNLARYDGSTWYKVHKDTAAAWIECTDLAVNTMLAHGGLLYVGGDFGRVNDTISASKIASWDGNKWSRLGAGGSTNGLTGNSASCYAMTIWNGQLVVGGRFSAAGGVAAYKVTLWTGSGWRSINSGTVSASVGAVHCLGSYQGKLFAGGDFNGVGGFLGGGLLVYDSVTWKVANGQGFDRRAIEPFNGMLWVGGLLSELDFPNPVMSMIYTYDLALDSIYTISKDHDGFDNAVNVMTVFRDELYIGGELSELRGINISIPVKKFGYICKARRYCEDKPTGIAAPPLGEAGNIVIYPNPATGEVFIKNVTGAFRVFNIMGIQCGQGTVSGKSPYRYSMESLPPGMYYFHFAGGVAKACKL